MKQDKPRPPFKIQGRVKHCVIENLPVIARDGEAPECYVGGDADFVLRAMNSYHALLDALKRMRCTCDASSRYGHYDNEYCNLTIARAAIESAQKQEKGS